MGLLLLKGREPIRVSESISSAVSTRILDGGRIHRGFLCHLEARMTLTSSTTALRDGVSRRVLKNIETKLTFKLREQRDTFFIKAGQGARIPLLCSLVYCKLSVLIAEVFCASVSPSL